MNSREENTRRGEKRTGSVYSDSFCFLTSYGIECSILLFCIGTSIYSIAVQNFYIDRICHVEYNISWAECHNLTSKQYENDEKIVEVTASKYVIYQNLIEYGFPILLSFFLGAWTDKHGSKLVLIVSLLGYFIATIFYTTFSFLPDIHPKYILLSSVPIALGGGLTALIISACSYITRECSLHNRSLRLACLSICFDGGATIGYFLGEKIYTLLGYTQLFFTSAFLCGLSVICAIFLVYEKKPEISLDNSSLCCVTEFFDVDAVKDTFTTSFRKRQNNRRRCILLMTSAMFLQLLSWSVKSYTYLFTRNEFGWKFQDFSDFSIATSLMSNIGGLLLTFVAIKYLQIRDVYLGLIACFSNMSGYLLYIFATSAWFMYLGSGVQMLGALTTAVTRSILSKCVDPEEHGKLFSLVTCIELAMPFVAGPLYGVIYMNTAMTLPSAIYLVPVGINVINALSYLYLHFKMESFVAYSPIREDAHTA